MEQPDIEGEAAAILRLAGYDIHDAPRGLELAQRLGINVRATDGALVANGDACFLELAPFGMFIFVKRGLGPAALNFSCCHEVAECHLRRCGYREPDIERVADALGAALLVPGPLFRRCYRKHGENWQTAANELVASQTLTLLRFGEVTGHPVAVKSPEGWRVRGEGAEAASFGANGRVARIVHRSGRRLRRVHLTDQAGRVAIYPKLKQ